MRFRWRRACVTGLILWGSLSAVVQGQPDGRFPANQVASDVEPVVKVWDENVWAELHDARTGAVVPSLLMFDGVHRRWAELFRSLTEEQWKRRMIHPERGVVVLDAALPMFVWHGRHHTAHIAALCERIGIRLS